MEVYTLSRKNDAAFHDLISSYFSISPRDVEGLNNTSVIYYRDKLIRQLFGLYEISGAPDGWDMDYLKSRIFLDGKCCITDTKLGVLPLRCGVSGINVFDHPTTCVIANPVLGSLEKTIEKDCALVHLNFNYFGVWPIINRYSTLLSLCDSALSVNLINSKTAYVFGAETKAEAESFKLMSDQISTGKPSVFVSQSLAKKLNDRLVFNNVKESFVALDIQSAKTRLKNEFLVDVGINNANTEKRERLNAEEVRSNWQEVESGAQHWLDNVNAGFAVANKLYGLELKMKQREWNIPDSDREGGAEDEFTEPD